MPVQKQKIVDRRTNTVLAASVKEDVTREELVEVQQNWRNHKVRSLLLQYREAVFVPEHNHWDWPAKHSEAHPDFHKFFALFHDDQIEGLMMLSVMPIPSRIAGQSQQDVLYVEYIESAPWNLAEYSGPNIQYQGIGSALLAAAAAFSDSVGCSGRLALKSLPSAEGFYRKMGFVDLGIDAVEKLTYFELPSQTGGA